jgi:serine kinase of HPr protein (carbohydrate metabolism regulator)
MTSPSVHANALVVGGAGILIRGASKAGKSSLTVALIQAAQSQGLASALIGDDRVFLRMDEGRLMAAGHPAIRGQIHVRGFGIVDMPSEDSAPVKLVIDLVREQLNMPTVSSRVKVEGLWVEQLKIMERSQTPDLLMVILEKIR